MDAAPAAIVSKSVALWRNLEKFMIRFFESLFLECVKALWSEVFSECSGSVQVCSEMSRFVRVDRIRKRLEQFDGRVNGAIAQASTH